MTAISRERRGSHGHWICRCDCGKTHSVRVGHLFSGAIKSCGCFHNEVLSINKKTHGRRKDRIYAVWCSMKRRAKGNHPSYKNIDMDPRWEKFEAFIEDMGEPTKESYTIDRINNKRGYWLNNCRWVSMKVQQRNRTNNRMITHYGNTLCVAEWSEKLGIPYFSLYSRLKIMDWNMKLAISSFQ